MVQFVKGNLLESDCDCICHQVNCMGKMNSGIAKQIRQKWPEVYLYYATKCNNTYEFDAIRAELLLGDIQFVQLIENPKKYVINMFSQCRYGYDRKRYTSYDAFWNCLEQIKKSLPKNSSIGFPKGIGCGLGGANWEVIKSMIYEVLDNDFKVYIYDFRED